MKRKLLSLIAAAALTASTFAGCGAAAGSGADTKAPEEKTEETQASTDAESSEAESTEAAGPVDISNVGVAGTADPDHTEIKFSKSWGPYSVLFEEQIAPLLEAQGYTVTPVEFADLQSADVAVQDGEADVNVEQHTAYMENYNESQGGDLVNLSPIPTVPAGIYSATHKSVDEIADGMTVLVPDDAANTARAYALLQKAGWITLDSSKDLSTVTQADITENPYNLTFTEMTSVNIPPVLSDADFAVITGSIVYNAKIDPSTALLTEDILPHLILQVVVKSENKDAQWAKDIVAAYHSQQLKDYMDSTNNENGLWYVPEELTAGLK